LIDKLFERPPNFLISSAEDYHDAFCVDGVPLDAPGMAILKYTCLSQKLYSICVKLTRSLVGIDQFPNLFLSEQAHACHTKKRVDVKRVNCMTDDWTIHTQSNSQLFRLHTGRLMDWSAHGLHIFKNCGAVI